MDAIPTPIQTVLELFATSLADVRFADLDASTLARLASDVDTAAMALAAAQTTLDAAREELRLRQDALLQHAQRALAYARVYAENDEALTAKLDALALPRAPRKLRAEEALVLSAEPNPAPRKRGRPKKAMELAATEAAPLIAIDPAQTAAE